MTAQILQFPKPGGEPFTVGDCIRFADLFCEDALLSNARHLLEHAGQAIADGRAGEAVGAMIISSRLLDREIFEVRRTSDDQKHVLFTGHIPGVKLELLALPKEASGKSEIPAPRRRRAPRPHPLLSLPFVVDRPKGTRGGRRFWHVSPTGDYLADYELGAQLAQQYLEFRDCMPPSLGWIVGDMPRNLTGVEAGFLAIVGRSASPSRARQLREHASRAMAEFAARSEGPE
jgi:hypothetical protein